MNNPIQTSVLDRTLSFGCLEVKYKRAVQISLILVSLIGGLTIVSALYGVLPDWTKWAGVSLIPVALATCASLNCRRSRRLVKKIDLLVKKIDLSNDLVTKYPKDVLLQIFKHLNEKDLATASLCCKQWHFAASDYNLWESLYSKDHAYIPQFNTLLDLKKACFEPWLGTRNGKLSISIKTINPEIKFSVWTNTDKYLIGVDFEKNVKKLNLSTGKIEASWDLNSDKSNEISSLDTYKNKLIVNFKANKSDPAFECEPFRQVSIINLNDGKIKNFQVNGKKSILRRNTLFYLSKDSSIKALNIEKETWSSTIHNVVADNFELIRSHERHLITINSEGTREIWALETGKKIGEFSRFILDKQNGRTLLAYGIYDDKEIFVQKNKTQAQITVYDLISKKSYERILDFGLQMHDVRIWKNRLILIGYTNYDFCMKGIDLESGDTFINLHNSNSYLDGNFISSCVHEGKVIFGTDKGTLSVYDLLTGKLQCKTKLVKRSIFQYAYNQIEKIRAYRNIILAYIKGGTIIKYTLEPK